MYTPRVGWERGYAQRIKFKWLVGSRLVTAIGNPIRAFLQPSSIVPGFKLRCARGKENALTLFGHTIRGYTVYGIDQHLGFQATAVSFQRWLLFHRCSMAIIVQLEAFVAP